MQCRECGYCCKRLPTLQEHEIRRHGQILTAAHPERAIQALPKKPVRMSLVKIQSAFFGAAKKSWTDTVRMISGIEIRNEEDSLKTIDELRGEAGSSRFTLRGIRPQLFMAGVRGRGIRLARKVIYAAHPEPTHRVLVYAFAGSLLMESSYEDHDGEISILPVYLADSYIVTPLAKVDVRVNLDWFSSRYKDLGLYREAVMARAERIAWEWFRVFCMRFRKNWRTMAPWSSGLTAEVVRSLTPSARPKSEFWKDANNIETGLSTATYNGVDQTPPPFSREVYDMIRRGE